MKTRGRQRERGDRSGSALPGGGLPIISRLYETLAQRVPVQVPGLQILGGRRRQDQTPVADKAIAAFKQRIRELTRRSGGCSLDEAVKQLRVYVLGWKAYFRLAETPGDLERSGSMDAPSRAGHPA